MMDRLAEPNAPEISNETLIQIYDDNVFDCQGLSESTAHVGSIINIATAGMLQKCLSKDEMEDNLLTVLFECFRR